MELKFETYREAQAALPVDGQQIIGHQQEEAIVVYQAYKPSIAKYAVANQQLGGSEFSYNRMSWIKPNFLWMMYRCGWGEKENQERVIALWVRKKDLQGILADAVLSTYDARFYGSFDLWRKDMGSKDVRMQWDPDHDPYGAKLRRRSIQLGLKGYMLRRFGMEQLLKVEDITEFVRAQKAHVDSRRLDLLQVPLEKVWELEDAALKKRVGVML